MIADAAELPRVFVEFGVVVLILALLARVAHRFDLSPIPLYLLAGLTIGEQRVVTLDVSRDFVDTGAEIGVVLLLLALGLQFTAEELRVGLRSGFAAGAVDAAANFSPGFIAGLILGWGPATAVLLGGVTYISSSGIISKLLGDLGRLSNRETPVVRHRPRRPRRVLHRHRRTRHCRRSRRASRTPRRRLRPYSRDRRAPAGPLHPRRRASRRTNGGHARNLIASSAGPGRAGPGEPDRR